QSALTPNTTAARSKLAALERAVITSREVAAQNQANQIAQQATEAAVQTHIVDWLEDELEKLKAEMAGSTISCVVRRIAAPDMPALTTAFRARIGVELEFSNVGTNAEVQHAFQLYFCNEFRVRHVTSSADAVQPPEDRVAAVIPAYEYRLSV